MTAQNKRELSALYQKFKETQAKQSGNASEARESIKRIIQEPNIREMLIRLRDK